MARKVWYFMLIGSLLTSAHLGMAAPGWEVNLDNLSDEINRYVQDVTRNVSLQIQNSVQPALAQVHETIENLPRDGQGRIITNGQVITSNSNVMININSVNGTTKKIITGRAPNGEPFVNIIEERRYGKYLYHDETSSNPRTNVTERIRWRLDLVTPGAQIEILTNDQ